MLADWSHNGPRQNQYLSIVECLATLTRTCGGPLYWPSCIGHPHSPRRWTSNSAIMEKPHLNKDRTPCQAVLRGTTRRILAAVPAPCNGRHYSSVSLVCCLFAQDGQTLCLPDTYKTHLWMRFPRCTTFSRFRLAALALFSRGITLDLSVSSSAWIHGWANCSYACTVRHLRVARRNATDPGEGKSCFLEAHRASMFIVPST